MPRNASEYLGIPRLNIGCEKKRKFISKQFKRKSKNGIKKLGDVNGEGASSEALVWHYISQRRQRTHPTPINTTQDVKYNAEHSGVACGERGVITINSTDVRVSFI